MLGFKAERGISLEKSTTGGDHGKGVRQCRYIRVEALVWRLTVFALGLNLDENLLLAHHFDDLSDVRPGLLQELQLLPQQTH